MVLVYATLLDIGITIFSHSGTSEGASMLVFDRPPTAQEKTDKVSRTHVILMTDEEAKRYVPVYWHHSNITTQRVTPLSTPTALIYQGLVRLLLHQAGCHEGRPL